MRSCLTVLVVLVLLWLVTQVGAFMMINSLMSHTP